MCSFTKASKIILLLLIGLLGCTSFVELPQELTRVPVSVYVDANRMPPSWITGGADAWVPENRVIVFKKKEFITRSLLAEELCHVMQREFYGSNYDALYARLHAQHGYENNPLEVECNSKRSDPWFLDWSEHIRNNLDDYLVE